MASTIIIFVESLCIGALLIHCLYMRSCRNRAVKFLLDAEKSMDKLTEYLSADSNIMKKLDFCECVSIINALYDIVVALIWLGVWRK